MALNMEEGKDEDRARIYKRLWSPELNSEESISPAYVAWRAGTKIGFRTGPSG
jgi:hypothetical protein